MKSVNQILGYVLLIAGVVLIALVLYLSYGIFVQANDPPPVFELTPWGRPSLPENGGQDVSGMAEGEVPIGQIMEGVLPAEVIAKNFNLLAWAVFAFIAIFGGTKVAGLGVKLVKD